jgi:hypothetical protein
MIASFLASEYFSQPRDDACFDAAGGALGAEDDGGALGADEEAGGELGADDEASGALGADEAGGALGADEAGGALGAADEAAALGADDEAGGALGADDEAGGALGAEDAAGGALGAAVLSTSTTLPSNIETISSAVMNSGMLPASSSASSPTTHALTSRLQIIMIVVSALACMPRGSARTARTWALAALLRRCEGFCGMVPNGLRGNTGLLMMDCW